MRVLCCLDGTNVERLSQAVGTLLQAETRTLGILYVTDSGPEKQMEQHRERFLRPPRPPLPRREQMQQAEETAAQQILAEASRSLVGADRLWRRGRPEREIVQVAAEWQADILVIGARSGRDSRSPRGPTVPLGPKSIGHVARFVLDHAPCPVLLIRQQAGNSPPLPAR